jgi:hypothetical protein
MGGGSAMTIVMYAIKCANGYIKVEEDGFKIVDMQKASVFKNVQDVHRAIIDNAPDMNAVHAVELTITERAV